MRWAAMAALVCLAGCGRVEPARPGEQRSGLFLIIRQNGRYGFVNSRGEVKIAPQFDQAAPFSEGLAVVATGGRAGYIDTGGKFAINPQFEGAAPFADGLAAVRAGNAWGFIDKHGKMVIPTRFQAPGASALEFSEGLAAVRDAAGRVGYIDHAGRMAVPDAYEYALPFSDGRALVGIGGRYGYIDKSGKTIVNPQYEDASSFFEDRAAVRMGARWGYIDGAGKMAVPPQFDAAHVFSDGLAPAACGRSPVRSRSQDLVREQGARRSRCRFISDDEQQSYRGKSRLPGGLRRRRAIALSQLLGDVPHRRRPCSALLLRRRPQRDPRDFCHRLRVSVGGRMGFIDKAGKMAVNPQFDAANDFRDGLAPVRVGQRWGYIDKSGKMAIHPQFDNARPFSPSLAPVQVGPAWGYVDRDGKMVWSPSI